MQNRQVICKDFGPPANLTIEASDIPSPQEGEVLVKVLSVGVGYVDSLMVQGLYQVKPPLPYYPGSEFAGEIIQVGGAVSNIKSGDLVMGMWRGAYTDHMTVPSSECTVIPDSLSVDVAGGFYTNYSTALFGLRDCGKLKVGENV